VAVEQVCLGKVEREVGVLFGDAVGSFHRGADAEGDAGAAAPLVADGGDEILAADIAEIVGGGSSGLADFGPRGGALGVRLALDVGELFAPRRGDPETAHEFIVAQSTDRGFRRFPGRAAGGDP
jgi:hypothetical protein